MDEVALISKGTEYNAPIFLHHCRDLSPVISNYQRAIPVTVRNAHFCIQDLNSWF